MRKIKDPITDFLGQSPSPVPTLVDGVAVEIAHSFMYLCHDFRVTLERTQPTHSNKIQYKSFIENIKFCILKDKGWKGTSRDGTTGRTLNECCITKSGSEFIIGSGAGDYLRRVV